MTIIPYTRKVQYYETDQMGIVHHSNYIRWFEEARVDLLEQLGFGYHRAVAARVDFAVLGVSCEYRSMARFGEAVNLELRVSSLEAFKMSLEYRVTDSVTGELRATGESRHCYYHSEKKRPVSLKKELAELYELFAELSSTCGCFTR